MPDTNQPSIAPEKTVPYILRAGEGRCLYIAGQLIRLVASAEDTAGGFGAVVCEATHDRQPIPLHYHEREHDTWFCTRGRLRIWCQNESRVLTPGDFAYVKPGDVHSYQSVAPRTQFFGVVAPGGWERFFREAGEEWSQPGLPAANHPFDFARLGGSMAKYRVMRAAEATFAEVSNGDETDRMLPERPSSYVLQAGNGLRSILNGHLSTALLTRRISDSRLDMRTIEGGRGARMPAVRHEATHLMIYVVEGVLQLTLDGTSHVLTAGDCANVPAGVSYATEVQSGQAVWLLTGANGAGLSFWDTIGTPAPEFTFPNEHDPGACAAALRAGTGGDVALVD